MKTGLLFLAAALVLAAMICVSPYPSQAQGQDPTILARQGELALTAQAQAATQAALAAAARAATVQRQQEINALRDAQTRTSMQITASAATAQYWDGQTVTPIAMTAQANQATSTAQTQDAQATATMRAIATSTGFANATGTAHATETQVAGTALARQVQATSTAYATQTQIAGTATATTVYATAVAQATADANAQRQITLNQLRQAVYIGGALALVFFTPVLGYLIWKKWAACLPAPQPAKPVVIVEEPELVEAPRGSVSFDPAVAEYMINVVRQDLQREVAP